ncbi:MAG: glycine oxidase ThiO [Actinomycetota bacterium]|nr:glycine oxidase ThiO [Actinomycetota bacterium]
MPAPQAESTADVVVVGGGVLGLAIAWRVAAAGSAVTVVDPAPGRGASWAAAGMLAPVTEASFGEEALLALNLDSVRRYPTFVEDLEDLTGIPVGYRTTGTLAVAADTGDRAVLAELARFQVGLGLATEVLTGRECRVLEPMLAPGIRGGLFVAGDHQIDNRRLSAALLAAVERAGGVLRRERVEEVACTAGRASGVRLAGGERLDAPVVVLAAGCWSAGVAGLPPDVVPPVRPVKGQILRLRDRSGTAPFLSRAVRALVSGGHVYVVPRLDGEIVVGASVEEMGFDTRVTAGAVYELLRDARTALPGLGELELVESHAGLRPGSPDNAPLLGPTALPGLVLATGHFRNGILLTPVTADVISAYVLTGVLPEVARPFVPTRFAPAAVA